jgi:hypothetical protein
MFIRIAAPYFLLRLDANRLFQFVCFWQRNAKKSMALDCSLHQGYGNPFYRGLFTFISFASVRPELMRGR